MDKATVRDVDVRGKRVLERVDFNVPLDDNGRITDDTRIRASLPTIHYLLDNGAAVILMSHLGRPKGKPDPKFSLRPVAARLSELLGKPVALAEDCVGPDVEAQAHALQPSQVLLLENLRFHSEEEA
ncbi:MAG TPA: phosphoglycerate kinase, partial [Ktedonobacterales bacterium]|nr:phosphoglycerate kinase [Ktedonobacterales bacterium]